MVSRARLSAPRQQRDEWPWHRANWTDFSASLLTIGDRRLEAENYLTGGYGIRLALEARKSGWANMVKIAKIWQPSRLKGIQVESEFGTPFLTATQVFDFRPAPRKFLSLDRTDSADTRLVTSGMILVTRSGSVGRTTLAYKPHGKMLISDDLLRVEPQQPKFGGWLYAYLRSSHARAMMNSAKYGHVIKHLEVSHLEAMPIPLLRDALLQNFNDRVEILLMKRNKAYELHSKAEVLFENAIGPITIMENSEIGFCVRASSLFDQRRRLEGGFYTPVALAILQRLAESNFKIDLLSDLWEREWKVTRNKSVFSDAGMPYMSADELFTLNSPITKRIMIEQTKNGNNYFGKSGWIVMACSGQIYGLNGSVMLLTERHESFYLSQDLIRIIPNRERVRPGYLCAVLGHPKLGRPLILRYAYGTSIPHLEPADVANCPVVRLGERLENEIADSMEESVSLSAEANELENSLAADADILIDRFRSEITDDFVLSGL